MKVCPPNIILALLKQLDEKVLETFELCTGVSLSPSARTQVFLPTRMGGIGLRDSSRLAGVAFTTSVLTFRAVGIPLLSIPGCVPPTQGDLLVGLEYVGKVLPPAANQAFLWISIQVSLAATGFHHDFCSLSWWGQQLAVRARDMLFDQSHGRDRARLRCTSDTCAGAWLDPCPTEALGLRLTHAEYSILLKWWLGINLLALGSIHTCSSCGDTMDAFGDHLLCCKKGGLIQRHTTICKQLWHMSTAAGLHATCEVSLNGRTRPADILLSHWRGGGPCAIDVAVVHPLAPSIPCHAVKSGLESVNAMERVKHNKYDEGCRQSSVVFSPFVLSTFGRLGVEADRFFRSLTSALHRRLLILDNGLDGRKYQQQLQVALKREVARMLLQGIIDTGTTDPPPSQDQGEDSVAQEVLDDFEHVYALLEADSGEEPNHSSGDNGIGGGSGSSARWGGVDDVGGSGGGGEAEPPAGRGDDRSL